MMSPAVRALLLASALSFPAAAHAADPKPAPAAPAGIDLLPVGSPAPTFKLTAHDGTTVDLAKLRGRNVVLYFYPKDDTPGCTKQACSFRDAWSKLRAADVTVLGVSTDANESHKAFAAKYNLPFPLLPDPEGKLAGAYKVPLTNGLAKRITYLIGKDGKIQKVWPQVKPEGHADEILAAVAAK
jgi:thioredoxin-dependent peroxiredoxin